MHLYLVEYQMFHCMRESQLVNAKSLQAAESLFSDPYTVVLNVVKARLKHNV